ncbi:heat shock factor binding protein 1-domain-containing protein [Lasiosphaeria ovina]|uniref:Heat shock factor binding protein 1-domain-containing protein n=1 Tax=Lasiosphaeria ovina TaxID=92902 RepID=A0AAE0KDB4_9PEZI|nr:heat shock factor binding protein 1-domain-containing protein [Lasiosphaeria ovina]
MSRKGEGRSYELDEERIFQALKARGRLRVWKGRLECKMTAKTKVQTSDNARSDLTAQVEDLLNTLSNKFAGVSSEIFAKMDEMSRRLDNLEAQLMANKDKGAPPN